MNARRLNAFDQMLSGIDRALRTVAAPTGAGARPNPASGVDEGSLAGADRAHAAGLMRVNHAGEVAAQALYAGHALVARDHATEEQMQKAAGEELDHLAWCEQRLAELDAQPSRLGPVWYGGAFLIGAASGILGDKWSLGFIAETEQQVCEHLKRHLDDLPANDARSRAILARMHDEEAGHGEEARAAGAAELPAPVRRLMQLASKVMTSAAYRV